MDCVVVCDKKRKSLKHMTKLERERERERERDREERLLCSKMQCLGYYINPKYFFFYERATLGEFFL